MALQQLGKYLLASVAKILLIHSLKNPSIPYPATTSHSPLAYSVRGRGRWLLMEALKDRRGGEVGDIMWNLLNWTKPDSESTM